MINPPPAPCAYACTVNGDFMAPALRVGDVVDVDPARPLAPGCEVIATLADGTRGACLFVGQGTEGVVLGQLNPAFERSFPPGEVVAIERIVARRESP